MHARGRALDAMPGAATLDGPWASWVPARISGRVARAKRAGANGATALPYFSATGKRPLFCDVCARDQLGGLSTATTPTDLVMAVCACQDATNLRIVAVRG